MQRAEHGQQSGGACQRHPVFALQCFHQAGAAQDFGVQTFSGQKQNSEVGGVRRLHVFLRNRFSLQPDAQLQRLACVGGIGSMCPALRVQQPLIVFVGKFGVNRQPQGCAVFGLARQLDGKVHHVFAAGACRHLGRVLVAHKHLFQQRGQLRLAKNAPGFDVAQQVLQVAHALGQGLHFAQAFVHLLQLVGHLFETCAQARLQRGLQLFVHGGTHLVELGRIGSLQLGQLGIQGLAHLGQGAGAGFAEFGNAPGVGLAQTGELGV